MEEVLRSFLSGEKKDFSGKELYEKIETSKKKYHNLVQKYELWREFLKRSERYYQVCQWIKLKRKTKPYPIKSRGNHSDEILDFGLFGETYLYINAIKPPVTLDRYFAIVLKNMKKDPNKAIAGSFFLWALENEFPFDDELLMNYFVFGNIFDENKLAKSFNAFRLILIIELQNRAKVFELHETMKFTFEMVEQLATQALGREPTIHEFKEWFESLIKNDYRLHICISNPYKNKDELMKLVSDLIDNRRENDLNSPGLHEKDFEFFDPNRFEVPGKKIRTDDLKRYLDVYDQKQQGKKNKELAKMFYPQYDLTDADLSATALRYVSRDLSKARKIIKNVEMGYFPGKYQ
jgi:hypothetical protein